MRRPSSSSLAIARRDLGLSKVRQMTTWAVVVSLGVVGAVSAVLASELPGRSSAPATTPSQPATSPNTSTNAGPSSGLQAPSSPPSSVQSPPQTSAPPVISGAS